MRTPHALSILLTCAPLFAQSGVVSPLAFTHAEAPVNLSLPFGAANPIRFLQVHDDMQGSPRFIMAMSLRQNGNGPTTPFAPFSVMLDAYFSTAATTSTTMNINFDLNHGADKAQVVFSKAVNFPATGFALVPAPFDLTIPFDVPFVFRGLGPLCWEVLITTRTNTGNPSYQDAASNSSKNPPLATAFFGTGCKVSGASAPMSASGSSSMNWPGRTGSVVVNGAYGPANGAVLVALGVSNSKFAGVPLPYLLPGSATAPSGPCQLYTDLVLLTAGTTNSGGASTTSISVPATPDLNGLRTFEQIWALDAGANSIGLVLSNAVNHNWVAPYTTPPVSYLFTFGVGPTGTITVSEGLVIRVEP